MFFYNLIRVAERFFSGVPQPPPPWRLLPESFFIRVLTLFNMPIVDPKAHFFVPVNTIAGWVDQRRCDEHQQLLLLWTGRLAAEQAPCYRQIPKDR